MDYDTLKHEFLTDVTMGEHTYHFLPSGQHLGIFLVELGVGITVTAVMTMIFYAFVAREPATK